MSINPVRRRLVAAAGTIALGVGALVVAAPAAQADTQQVSSSQLTWGVKSSFRSYIVNIGGGTIAASGGAAKTGGNTSTYTWTGAGGSYDPAAKVGQLDFSGTVVFSAPAHTIWNITIANPTVVLDGDGTGTLIADVSYATGGTQAAPENVSSKTDVAFGEVTVGAPAVSGSTYTFTDQPVTLTAAGSEAFDGFYEPGTAMDALTATATLQQATTPTDPPTDPPTNPPAKPDAVTALVTAVTSTLASVLGALGAIKLK